MKTDIVTVGMDLQMNATEELNVMNNEFIIPTLSDIDDVQLFSEDGSLPSDVDMDAFRKLVLDKASRDTVTRIYKAIAFTRTVKILKELGVDSVIGKHLLYCAVDYSSFWEYFIKGERGLTYGRQIYNSLLRVVSEDSLVARSFVEASQFILKNYTKDADKVTDTKILVTRPVSDVTVKILNTGLRVAIKHGTVIQPKSGNVFQFERDSQTILNTKVLNKYLENVLRNVVIHQEIKIPANGQAFAKDYITFSKDKIQFRKADVLSLLLILKDNKIDLTSLFEDQSKGGDKKLVLVRKLDGSIQRMYVPGYTFAELYSNTGAVSLTEARQGIISPKINIPRLVEFGSDSRGNDFVVTRENVNKTINRIDKLHDKDGWTTKPVKFLVVSDSTNDAYINDRLITGNAFMPTSWLRKHGVCRIVTDMDEGGIKAATSCTSEIDRFLDEQDIAIVGASAFKGGMLSALSLAKGDKNLIKNLSNLVSKSQESIKVMNKIKALFESELKDYVIASRTVKGILIEVPVIITNAYTVESVMLNTEYSEHDFNAMTLSELNEFIEAEENKLPDLDKIKRNIDLLESELLEEARPTNGLRDSLMNRVIAEEEFMVGDWLEEGLKTGKLIYKPTKTRIIASELQSIAVWYGDKVAKGYLKALLAKDINKQDIMKVYAAQYLLGDLSVSKELNINVIIDTLVQGLAEHKQSIQKGYSVYPQAVLSDVVSLFEVEGDFGWVDVKYPDGSLVHIPCGSIFKHDFNFDSKEVMVVAKGLVNDLLENIKSMLDMDGNLYSNATETAHNARLMNAIVQRPLFGKNFGYQLTKGFYGVMLPNFDAKPHELAMTNRNRLMPSNKKFISVNGSKAPQLFKESTGGYHLHDKDMGDDQMNLIFSCAIFISAEATMIMQNDHDGDLFRITVDGYNLPLFKGPASEFNGKFFTNFIADEFSSNKLKVRQSALSTLTEFHTEIFNAVEAKSKVGQYTSNKYFYEAALPNVKDFVGTDGLKYSVNMYDTYIITAILSQLVQMEAMDNIKQEGSSDFISDLLLSWKLKGLRGFNGLTDEEAIEKHLDKVKVVLSALSETYSMNLTVGMVNKYVQALYYVAKTFNNVNMPAMSLMSARCINERNITDIMNDINIPEYEYKGIFDFFNSYSTIINNEIDTKSMYYQIVVQTVESILG